MDERSPPGSSDEGKLGRIALKQVRVSRSQVEGSQRQAGQNPMNRLVPYLDLFARLGDEELAVMASVPAAVVQNLRKQVFDVNRALARYVDLLPRLSDEEFVRLTGATAKTIRFWRLSQPRTLDAPGTAEGKRAIEQKTGAVRPKPESAAVHEAPPTPSDSVVASLDTGLSGQPFPGFDPNEPAQNQRDDHDDTVELGSLDHEPDTAKEKAVAVDDEYEDLGDLLAED